MYPNYGGISQPGVGSGSNYGLNFSYSSNIGARPTAGGAGFSDPFAKPSIPSYSAPTQFGGAGGYGGSFGGSYGGGYSGFGGPSSVFGTSSTINKPSPVPTTTYGYGKPIPSTVSPAIQAASSHIPPSVKIGTTAPVSGPISYGGPSVGGYGASTSYGLPTPAPQVNPAPYQPISSPPKPSTVAPLKSDGQGVLTIDEINDLSKAGKQLFSNAFQKSSTKSAYQDLVKQLIASGQKYKDLDFPNELRSLTGGLSEYELAASGNPLNWRSLIWLRAEEIYGKGNYTVFQGNIEPGDIKQGALGDCYFLSTLASLAEFPARIRKLFENEEPNEQGCYAIKICDMGIWQTIILDDYMPCSAKSRQPVFTKGNGSELWVQLLEKAWAKIYGSYARIEAGLTRECLHDLTGAPTKYYLTGDPKKYDDIWDAISHGEKKNFVMTCGAGDFFEGADLMNSIGLVGSHAYSMLAALKVKDRYGKDVKLVKLRNPWGKGEWTGDWSDESPTWTPELKREVGLEDKDDGIFFMSFQDLLKYFSDIQICKVHDDFKYKSLKSSCDHRHANYFKLTVRVPGQYYITINQESKRKHEEKENYQYSEVSLVFGKITGNGFEYIEGIQKADKEVWTDGKLSAGEYIVYSKIAWNERKSREFSISAYGEGEVEIEQVPKTFCPDFIEKVYLNKGRQAKKFDDYKHCGVSNCGRAVELTDDGFGFIYYKNESNKTLEEELYFKFLEGLKLKKPFRGNNYKITVPPGQERIVITKVMPRAPKVRQAFTERARFI